MSWLTHSGMTPQDVVIFGGAVVLALILVMIAFATGANQSKQRLKRVTQISQKGDARPGATAVNVRRATADSSIAALDYMIKRWLPNPQKMRGRLLRTGRRISLGDRKSTRLNSSH